MMSREIAADVGGWPELMANLPTEVVTDILSRLPVKPLLRFRSVSKPCLALIDSPGFIKLHLNRSIESKNNNRSLLVRQDSISPTEQFPTYLIDLDSLDVIVDIDLPLKEISRQQYTPAIKGSCNGLVLLIYQKHVGYAETILLWNPFTKKHHKLPKTPIESQSPHRFGQSETYGIGYDSIRDDYKVVCMFQWHSVYGHTFYSEVQVYSLKSNSWTRIQDFPHYHLHQWHSVFCNGALHWLVSDDIRCESRLVAAFDLTTEEYRLVPTPNLVVVREVEDWLNMMHLEVLDRCLCMCNHRKVSIDVWVMKDYGVGESWTKMFSVPLPIDNMDYEIFSPLAFSKDGTQVLCMYYGYGLIWFDIARNSAKRIDFHGFPTRFGVEFVMQSLVPLGNGSWIEKNKEYQS